MFSGTGSVRCALEMFGFMVVSVDSDAKWGADHVEYVCHWRYWELYSPGDFEVVTASPPCTEYSTAMKQRRRRLRKADNLVRKAKSIIA